jgi:hypothetical protein
MQIPYFYWGYRKKKIKKTIVKIQSPTKRVREEIRGNKKPEQFLHGFLNRNGI